MKNMVLKARRSAPVGLSPNIRVRARWRIAALVYGLSSAATSQNGVSHWGEHSSYADGLLGPMLIIAAGLGLLFVPMSLVSLTKVRNADTGAASSLLNVGQQVGGSIGLALLGTVAWRAVANNLRSQTASAAAAAKAAGHPLTAATQTQI